MKQLLLSLPVMLLAVVLTGSAQTTRPVRLNSSDDLGLVATYYPVESESAPAALLLHNFGQKSQEWHAFALLLQRNGIAALALDLRGHGESTRKLTDQGAQLVDFRTLTETDFKQMLLDINLANDWLAAQ